MGVETDKTALLIYYFWENAQTPAAIGAHLYYWLVLDSVITTITISICKLTWEWGQ